MNASHTTISQGTHQWQSSGGERQQTWCKALRKGRAARAGKFDDALIWHIIVLYLFPGRRPAVGGWRERMQEWKLR
jgi:hypothetical protein